MNYIITAIDTDAGKSIVTGLLAKYMLDKGDAVITMKMAQTGCVERSEDIETHRKLMNIPWQDVDEAGTTCPYLFPFPASPHLSAQLVNRAIDTTKIVNAYQSLQKQYANVLLEGVGGLMVPLTTETLLVDFVKYLDTPVILVTSGRLGSINHTLLSLEVLKQRGITVYGVIYNHYPVTQSLIIKDSATVIKQYLSNYYPNALWGEIPVLGVDNVKFELNGWFK